MSPDRPFLRLSRDWSLLRRRFAPVHMGEVWACNRETSPAIERGWKIHVSASIRNAGDILQHVAAVCSELSAHFKTARTLRLISALNSGVTFGYSQVGKIFTIYPASQEHAAALLTLLVTRLRHYEGPAVPFDWRAKGSNIVFARYGQIRTSASGTGNSTADNANERWTRRLPPSRLRNSAFMQLLELSKCGALHHPIPSSYLPYKLISQRGKGGVYHALHFHESGASHCVMKEGRRNGEVQLMDVDGATLVAREFTNLKQLYMACMPVPKPIDFFSVGGNNYLVVAYVSGWNVARYIANAKRISFTRRLAICSSIADVVRRLHQSGWVWRDCKPSNLIISKNRAVGLDFEGATRVTLPVSWDWGSPRYSPTKHRWDPKSPFLSDIYGLVATVYEILFSDCAPRDIAGRIDRLDAVHATAKAQALSNELVEIMTSVLNGANTPVPTATEFLQVLDRASWLHRLRTAHPTKRHRFKACAA